MRLRPVISLLPFHFARPDTSPLTFLGFQQIMTSHDKAAVRFEKANLKNEVLSQHTPQKYSRLLNLPAELRVAIYFWVLASTQITYGETSRTNQRIKPTVNKSHPQALALLRVCRLITQDIGVRWINWAVFIFESPEALLDILTTSPTTCVAELRHVQVSGKPVMLSLPHDDVYYRLPWTMKLLPHLKLDTLTVLGSHASNLAGGSAQVDYTTIDEMITYGTGWRMFRYITPDSSMLSFPKTERFGQTYLRKPQPGTWTSVLSQRDGLESGSWVKIRRSTANSQPLRFSHGEQDAFEQAVASQDLEDYALLEDSFLATSSERNKATIVVAKRGRNADIMKEIIHTPYDQDFDLRALSSNMSWSEVRENFTEGGADEE